MVPEQDREEGQNKVGFNPGTDGAAHLPARNQAEQDAHGLGKCKGDDACNQHVIPHKDGEENVVADRSTQSGKTSNNVDSGGLGGSGCETHFGSFG